MSAERTWDDATPDEIRDAKIADLYQAIAHLYDAIHTALEYGTMRPQTDGTDAGIPAAEILQEEWSK